jgi:hypothetical protein
MPSERRGLPFGDDHIPRPASRRQRPCSIRWLDVGPSEERWIAPLLATMPCLGTARSGHPADHATLAHPLYGGRDFLAASRPACNPRAGQRPDDWLVTPAGNPGVTPRDGVGQKGRISSRARIPATGA